MMPKQGVMGAFVQLCVLGLCLVGCPKAPGPTAPPRVAPDPDVDVEMQQAPTASELLQRASDQVAAGNHAGARSTLKRLLASHPRHLEARVLLAALAEAEQDAATAAKAWTEVERILVFQGKLAPFQLKTTLYAAARYYVEADRLKRARLFLDELWRRYPQSDWSVKAQLALAESQHARGRWTTVLSTCDALRRLRPGHPSLGRCQQLSVSARRMLEVGPAPGPDAELWHWQHPTPQGNALRDLWIGSDGTLVMVGDMGTILLRAGRRGAPRAVPSGTRWGLNAVWGTGRDNIVAAGAAGIVLRYDGNSWKTIRAPKPEAPDLLGVYTAGPGHVVAVGQRGSVVRLEDGRWVVAKPADVTLHGVWGVGERPLYAVGDGGLLLRFDGRRWRGVVSDTYENLWSVMGTGAQQALAVGNRKTVVRLTQGGTKELVVGRGSFRDLWVQGEKAWAVGQNGEVVRYDGKRWQSELSGCLVDLLGVAGGGGSEVWAVGQGGAMLRRRGRRWTRVSGGLGQRMVAVTSAGGRPLALGHRGMVLQRDGRGRWSYKESLPLLGTYRDLWSDGRRWVAVGERGLMLERGPKGWQRVETDTAENLLGVWGVGQRVVAVGTRGTILWLEQGKVRAERSPSGLDLRAVWGDGKQLYAVGHRGTVLLNQGGAWRAVPSGTLADLTAVTGTRAGKVVAVGSSGTILELNPRHGQQVESPTSQLLVDVLATADGQLVAVSDRGGIFRDRGEGWRVDRSPAACLSALGRGPGAELLAVGCNGAVLSWKPAREKTRKK